MSMTGGTSHRRTADDVQPQDQAEAQARPATAPARGIKFLVCVDDSPQSRTALRFAALRARNTNGLLALLHVSEPVQCHGLMSIADAMEAEQRADAESLLERLASEVRQLTGLIPELLFRRGAIGSEILDTVRADRTIQALVVGASTPTTGQGRLVSWLAGELAGALAIPLVIVPGCLESHHIDQLA